MMKRIICTIAAITTVFWICPPARAEYGKCLLSEDRYSLEVIGPTTVSVTITYVTTRGKLELEAVLTLDGTTANAQALTTPRNAIRVIIEAETQVNSTALLKTGQAQKFEVPLNPNGRIVFDVSPGPLCGGS